MKLRDKIEKSFQKQTTILIMLHIFIGFVNIIAVIIVDLPLVTDNDFHNKGIYLSEQNNRHIVLI
jgi:hypothetical protein